MLNQVNEKIYYNQNENNNKNIEPIPVIFVVRAIGRNKKLHKDIDALYERNQVELYNNIMKDDQTKKIYESEFFKELGFINEIYSKKAFCIMINYIKLQNEEDEFIENLLIKGWENIYNYITANKRISLTKVTEYYIKKNPKWKVDDLIDIQVVSYYFCLLFNIELDTQDIAFKQFNDVLNFDIQFKVIMNKTGDDYWKKHIECSITDNDRKNINKIIEKIFGKYGEFETVDNLIYYYGKKNIENINVKIQNIISIEKLDASNLFRNANISRKDLEELIFCYFLKGVNTGEEYYIQKQNIDEKSIDLEDITKFLVNNIYLKLLLKEYSEIKEYYLLNNKETMFMKNQNLQNEIELLRNQMNTTNQNLQLAIKDYKKLEKENKIIKEKLKSDENDRVEVIELREFLFNIDAQEQYKEEDIDYSTLFEVKGAIVGGTQKWQNKMKKSFNNWSFITTENINFNEEIIKNAELVVIYVNYLSHALYYKVIDLVNKNNIKVKYIKHNQNIDMVTKQIYYAVMK